MVERPLELLETERGFREMLVDDVPENAVAGNRRHERRRGPRHERHASHQLIWTEPPLMRFTPFDRVSTYVPRTTTRPLRRSVTLASPHRSTISSCASTTTRR